MSRNEFLISQKRILEIKELILFLHINKSIFFYIKNLTFLYQELFFYIENWISRIENQILDIKNWNK